MTTISFGACTSKIFDYGPWFRRLFREFRFIFSVFEFCRRSIIIDSALRFSALSAQVSSHIYFHFPYLLFVSFCQIEWYRFPLYAFRSSSIAVMAQLEAVTCRVLQASITWSDRYASWVILHICQYCLSIHNGIYYAITFMLSQILVHCNMLQ